MSGGGLELAATMIKMEHSRRLLQVFPVAVALDWQITIIYPVFY